MGLDDYIVKGESKFVEVKARKGKGGLSDYGTGILSVTSNRLVFVSNDGSITDVSLSGVSSFEFTPPKLPTDWIIAGVTVAVFGLLFIVFREALAEIFTSSALSSGLGVLFLLLGSGLLVLAFLNREGAVIVHTPNESYRFSSTESELKNIMHAVRGQES